MQRMTNEILQRLALRMSQVMKREVSLECNGSGLYNFVVNYDGWKRLVGPAKKRELYELGHAFMGGYVAAKEGI